MVIAPIQCTIEDLSDRAKSFDMFRKSYRKNEAMEDNRNLLKDPSYDFLPGTTIQCPNKAKLLSSLGK